MFFRPRWQVVKASASVGVSTRSRTSYRCAGRLPYARRLLLNYCSKSVQMKETTPYSVSPTSESGYSVFVFQGNFLAGR